MEQENDNILQINSLVKSYGKKEVLKGLRCVQKMKKNMKIGKKQ